MRYGSRLQVDLNILSDNFNQLKNICPSNEVLFMVKADAYGHGLIPVSHFAYKELGIKEFGCATLGEALCLREELVDDRFEVYVFSDIQLQLENFAESYLHHRIIPVLTSFKDLDYFLEHPDFANFPLCLKFNTGMNRLGLPWQEVEKVADKLKARSRNRIYHLMSHFACASQSMKTNKRNQDQIERFGNIKSYFTGMGITIERSSISNSGAIEQAVGLEETHIRPGLMMYGPSSLLPEVRSEGQWQGKIISCLETTVLEVFDVQKGTPIGYGATVLPRPGRIAIIALGYGDGFSTRYQGVELEHKGQTGQVVGRVNMDMGQILFPEGADIKEGEKFVVWDHRPDLLERICAQSQTIPYEVFCSLTSRVPRVYSLN